MNLIEDTRNQIGKHEIKHAAFDAAGDKLLRCIKYFPSYTVKWGFALFKFSADTNPFIFVNIVCFFNTVYHKILSVLFDIAKCGIFHIIIQQWLC